MTAEPGIDATDQGHPPIPEQAPPAPPAAGETTAPSPVAPSWPAPEAAGPASAPPPAAERGRLARLVRGRAADPGWERPALLALLAGTAVLYVWGLGASDWGNSFYAAAVQAGTLSWRALFFGALDSSSYITVDKPPASLWMMALSGRVFGFSSWSMLVPNALCGVAAVGLLYGSVRRVIGPLGGLVAGLLFALTPVAVLMFRFNNPDALLVLLLVLGAYCVTRALESASWRWLALAGVAVGFGFLAKMMQAFLVVPAFGLVYLIAAPTTLRRRIVHVLGGVGGVLAGAGWWVATVELWPTSSRPYVGGSQDNSVLGLTFGYNGLGRIFGGDGNRTAGARNGTNAATSRLADDLVARAGGVGGGSSGGGLRTATVAASGGSGLPGGGSGGGIGAGAGYPLGASTQVAGPGGGGPGFGGSTGLGRLFRDDFGGQISWLLPAALILLVGGLWATRRAPRTDRVRAALILWGTWLLVTGGVFSYMQGTIHEYYTVALAPAVGGTVALGALALWRARDQVICRVLLAAAVGTTAVWSYVLLGRAPDFQSWLRLPVLVVGLVAAVILLAGRRAIRLTAVGLVAVAFGTLAAPAAFALDTASTAHTGATPLAGPSTGGAGRFGPMFFNEPAGGGGTAPNDSAGQAGLAGGAAGRGLVGGRGGPPDSAVTSLLSSGSAGFRWVAAVSSAMSAAQLELATGGKPVMAMGGFSGSDPAITLAEFQKYVADGDIHYFIGGGGFGGGGPAAFTTGQAPGGQGDQPGAPAGFGGGVGRDEQTQISTWVEAHFTALTIGGETVYDLTKPTS
jgi:4-amino-4-deoxy-L-arabinose transferase-like glycosyltransferase